MAPASTARATVPRRVSPPPVLPMATGLQGRGRAGGTLMRSSSAAPKPCIVATPSPSLENEKCENRSTLTLCVAAVALALSAPFANAEENYPPTIAVGGHGEVSTTPDRAQLALAVDNVDQELAKALSDRRWCVVRKYIITNR